MAKKITISFKDTIKDTELYNYLITLEEKSNEIKELIRKGLGSNNK